MVSLVPTPLYIIVVLFTFILLHLSNVTHIIQLLLAPSAPSTDSWEGAADIYNDYQHSRFSMASKMSRFSSLGRHPSSPGFHAVGPPITDSHPSIDSHLPPNIDSRAGIDLQRSIRATADRKMSVDSQSSVYTQASRSSSLGREIPTNASSSTNSTSPSPTPTPTQNH